jgi:hypothetical protein
MWTPSTREHRMIETQMTPDELRALPVSVDLVTAGRALGLGRTKSYELAKSGQFPIEVLPVGNGKYRVPRSLLLKALHVEEAAANSPAA